MARRFSVGRESRPFAFHGVMMRKFFKVTFLLIFGVMVLGAIFGDPQPSASHTEQLASGSSIQPPAPPPPPQWGYETSTDKMTSKPVATAMLRSENSLSLGFPYQGVNHGWLTIRRHPKYGTDVIVQVTKGQVLCRSYDGCTISVRFDDGKPARFGAVGPEDHSSEILFLKSSERFIANAKKAKRILVEIPMYQEGNQLLEFTTATPLVWPPAK